MASKLRPLTFAFGIWIVAAMAGRAAIPNENAPASIDSLEQAAAASPNDARIQNSLGQAYWQSIPKAGFFAKRDLSAKAKAAFDKAVALDPQNVDFRWSLMDFYRLVPAIAGGGKEQAYAEAGEIIKLDPARGHLAFATLYAAEKKYDQAFQEFEADLQNSPENYSDLYQIGRFAGLIGQNLDRGMAALNKCLALLPPDGAPDHASVQKCMGAIYERKGDAVSARAAYQAALQLRPDFRAAADALAKLDASKP